VSWFAGSDEVTAMLTSFVNRHLEQPEQNLAADVILRFVRSIGSITLESPGVIRDRTAKSSGCPDPRNDIRLSFQEHLYGSIKGGRPIKHNEVPGSIDAAQLERGHPCIRHSRRACRWRLNL
jgi:hypothetical protein